MFVLQSNLQVVGSGRCGADILGASRLLLLRQTEARQKQQDDQVTLGERNQLDGANHLVRRSNRPLQTPGSLYTQRLPLVPRSLETIGLCWSVFVRCAFSPRGPCSLTPFHLRDHFLLSSAAFLKLKFASSRRLITQMVHGLELTWGNHRQHCAKVFERKSIEIELFAAARHLARGLVARFWLKIKSS